MHRCDGGSAAAAVGPQHTSAAELNKLVRPSVCVRFRRFDPARAPAVTLRFISSPPLRQCRPKPNAKWVSRPERSNGRGETHTHAGIDGQTGGARSSWGEAQSTARIFRTQSKKVACTTVAHAALCRLFAVHPLAHFSLAADVRSYVAEHSTHESKYRSVSAAGSGADASEVRRAREFVDEASATLRDVRQRLQESWNNLSLFLAEIAVAAPDAAEILADPCVAEARAMLAEVSPLVNVGAAADSAGAAGEAQARAIRVCVLGDSQLNEGPQARQQAGSENSNICAVECASTDPVPLSVRVLMSCCGVCRRCSVASDGAAR